jgi:nucleoid DNA-binding protein
MADNKATAKAMPKSEVFKELASKTGLQAKQVSAVFDALQDLIKTQLGKKGPGLFVIPNLIKLKVQHKPAQPATRKPNPFKPGEMMEVKAKPASKKVKPIALKGLKDIAK